MQVLDAIANLTLYYMDLVLSQGKLSYTHLIVYYNC